MSFDATTNHVQDSHVEPGHENEQPSPGSVIKDAISRLRDVAAKPELAFADKD